MKEKFFKKIFFSLLSIIFITSVNADDKMRLGLEVYNEKAMCGSCHILKEADSNGDIGPNLDQLKPQKEKIIYTVTNGIGVMPAFQDTLTPEEIEAVAHYVFNSTNK
jgi:mono/diheme cytochrome c family protein|tara:strand:+ start:144 stop:464 length:321 start_codon:yes stop_codon:yes gene_type:complete